MSTLSSSSPNLTLSPLPLSNSSILSFYSMCTQYIPIIVLYTLYTIMNVFLILPLCVFVIYTGYRRRRQNTACNHSDILTYHIAAVEIFGILGAFLFCLGNYTNSVTLYELGILVPSVIFPGQTLFHCLTCLERYLAVVHPVVYRRLRETDGVRIRNVSIGCVWLLCFGWVGLTKFYLPEIPVTPMFCLFSISFMFMLFCSLSVLFALTHPGPKDSGRDKERVAQSKQRAFCIMMSITGVLVLRSGGLGTIGLCYLDFIQQEVVCAVVDVGLWLTVPSSLVLPLLFLHKTGRLVWCRHGTV